jgi:hypothetical protein
MTKLELYKKFEKEKFKYYLSKYPEVKHIFGKRNQALSFLECDGSYRAYNKLFRQYNKYCKILNEVQDNLTYGIAKLINDISEGANLEEILKYYKIATLEQLDEQQYVQLYENLDKREDIA